MPLAEDGVNCYHIVVSKQSSAAKPAPAITLDSFLPFRLSVASNMVSDVIAGSYAREFGVSVPEWRLIAVIAETDGLSQQQIGVRTRMDKVTVSRAAIALAGRGFVTRTPHPQDGRSNILALSDAGRELYRAIAPRALKLEREIFGALGDEELEAFSATLARITAAAERLLG